MTDFKRQLEIYDSISNYEAMVCPHCLQIDEDSWEEDLDLDVDISHKCPFCDKTFMVSKSITVYYTTSKPTGEMK